MGYCCSRCGGLGGLFESSHLHSDPDSCFAELAEEKKRLLLQVRELQEKYDRMDAARMALQDVDTKLYESNRLNSVLRTQLKGAVYFIHLDCHQGASFDQCKAPVCANANEVLGDLAERPIYDHKLSCESRNGSACDCKSSEKRKCECGAGKWEGARHSQACPSHGNKRVAPVPNCECLAVLDQTKSAMEDLGQNMEAKGVGEAMAQLRTHRTLRKEL